MVTVRVDTVPSLPTILSPTFPGCKEHKISIISLATKKTYCNKQNDTYIQNNIRHVSSNFTC